MDIYYHDILVNEMSAQIFQRPKFSLLRLEQLAFLALALLFFFPVVFQGRVIAPLDILAHLIRPWSDGAGGFGVHNAMVYDAISQYLPYDWTICRSLKEDGFIGWNPYVYGGFAMAENTMQCPGDWHHLLYRWLDFWTAWDLGIVLQFAVAGFGMIAMLKGEKITPIAALFGAVGYAFYSQHTTWIYHRWVLGTSCWFPWMVWAVRRARRKGRWFDPASMAFTALSLRGGSLQTCLYVALVCLALFAGEWWDWFVVRKGKKDGGQESATPLRCSREERPRHRICRLVGFWCALVVGASLLAADVLIDTIPACLAGSRQLADATFVRCLKRIPHFATLLVPSAFGSPQTMDLGKAFGADLFETKFIGVSTIVLAGFAFFKKKAPLVPKICIALVLFVTLTPLVKWFYFRSTVVFALGCAWLAAWAFDNLENVISDKGWKWIARVGAGIVATWTAVGIAVAVAAPKILPRVHGVIEKSIRADKESRRDWLLARADDFVAQFPPWTVHNAIPILLAACGLFAVWKSSRQDCNPKRKKLFATIVILCTFGELFVWSRTWITFSGKPNTDGTLFPVPEWAFGLREEMSDGGFLWIEDREGDFDYMQINAPLGIDIPCLQGYETIKPETLSEPDDKSFDTESFAKRGVSHVLVRPGAVVPNGLSAWTEVVNDDKLHLFRNPAFRSRFVAILESGKEWPLQPKNHTMNSLTFDLPSGVKTMTLAQTWHRNWTAELLHDGIVVEPAVSKNALNGMTVEIPGDIQESGSLTLRFR